MPETNHLEELEEQAALFAVGALPAEEAGQFQQRVAAGCPVCQALLRESVVTIAALPQTVPEQEPPVDLRSRVVERITGAKPAAPVPPVAAGTIVRAGDTPWEDSPVPGIQFRPLLGRTTMLVRMAPKTSFPGHEHAAAEQCLVLEGSVQSEGVVARAGDFTYMPRGSSHRPLYTDEGCLLLIAYT